MSQLIAAAALLDGAGRVLAAQRAEPAAVAGLWEFPGGKVEPGETPEAAVVRECREELGVEITLAGRLGGDVALAGGATLRVWRATIAAGVPTAYDHLALRWLAADELDDVEWLPGDAPLVDLLRCVSDTPGRTGVTPP